MTVSARPRYCTLCRTPLKWRTVEPGRAPQPVCPACGHVHWQNPKPTASALVTRRRGGRWEVLLVRRGVEPYRDHWDCPGGFMDPDEDPPAAIRRELREELGVEVAVGDLVGIYADRYDETGEPTLNIYHTATIRAGIPRPASDVSGLGWFPLDALPEPIAFRNNRQALAALAALTCGGRPPRRGDGGPAPPGGAAGTPRQARRPRGEGR